MTMKRILTLLIILTATITAIAHPKFDEEAYVAEQHKFVMKEVRMTSEEAKKFFTLYDEMRAKMRKVFNKMRSDRRKSPTTDADARNIIIERDNDGITLKKIEQQYHQKMLKVLPAKIVLDALIAADKFDKGKFQELNVDKYKKRCDKKQ